MGKRTRREFVVGSTVVGLAALSGCTGNGGGDGTATATATPTATATATPTATEATSPSQRVSSYLNAQTSAGNFDGTIVDKTGTNEVVVKVGAQGNGGNFAFAPPALKISTGTTITWEWTGKGNLHNVVSADSSDFEFRSGEPKKTGTYKNTFDSAGVGLYFCSPHRSFGMKGGFIVA